MKAVARSARYARVSEADVKFFKSIDPTLVVQDTERYFVDWMKKYHSESPSESIVLAPRTTEQVSRILAHCNQRMLAVVPQGEHEKKKKKNSVVGVASKAFPGLRVFVGLFVFK